MLWERGARHESSQMANAYPIIDFRALWSLNCEKRGDTFEFWWSYVIVCQSLALECGVSIRDLDRALWQCIDSVLPVIARICLPA
jgi:hypothetical protein